jgi:hypothetical protein
MSADDLRKRPEDAAAADEAATTPWQRRQELELELDLPSATEARANAPRNTGLAVSERSLTDSGPAPVSGLEERKELDIPAAPPRRRPVRTAVILVGVALLAAGLIGAGAYWVESQRKEGGLFAPSDEVLLLVMLRPKGAKLFVDGERTKTTSLQLPRARGKVVLRAEAPGHRPRQVVVDLATTRLVSLVLRRSGQRATTRRSRRGRKAKAKTATPSKAPKSSSPAATPPTIRPVAPDSPGPKPQATDDEKAPVE